MTISNFAKLENKAYMFNIICFGHWFKANISFVFWRCYFQNVMY